MIKVKKANVIYQIDKEYVNLYIQKGFVVVDEPKIEPIVEVTEAELRSEKSVGLMTKVELIELAETMGITLTGEEKINELRQLLR